MSNDKIYQRYMTALAEQQETSPVVRLALRLAIDEAATSTTPRNSTHPPYVECARQLDVLKDWLCNNYPAVYGQWQDTATAVLKVIDMLQERISPEGPEPSNGIDYHSLYDSTRSTLEATKEKLAEAKARMAELILEKQELRDSYETAQAGLDVFVDSPLPEKAEMSNHANGTSPHASDSHTNGNHANGINLNPDSPFADAKELHDYAYMVSTGKITWRM